MIRNTLRRLSSRIQTSKASFARHNAQYLEGQKLEEERAIGEAYIASKYLNSPTFRITDLLAKHPDVKEAVDVGSGTGWLSVALSEYVERVTAIEPSQAAIDIATSLYPDTPRISWMQGFAENLLPTLTLERPVLFVTGCVLSHLRDSEVQKICAAIEQVAPAGSVLAFSECWGPAWHQRLWHVRTREWWQGQLPTWTLDFHGPQTAGTDYFMGFHGMENP